MEQAMMSEEQLSTVTPPGETAGAACTESAPPQAVNYRFLSRKAEQQLRSVLERFAEAMSVSLSATLGVGVTAALEALEQTTRRGFRRSSSSTVLFRLSAAPYYGDAVLALSPGLVTGFLEKLLGGSGDTGSDIARELTVIESSVLDLALQTVAKDLREAWSGYAPIDFRLASQPETGFPSAEDEADEPMIAASVKFDICGAAGLMCVAVPWLAVIAVCRDTAEFGSSTATGESAPRPSVLGMLQNLNLRLEARLQGVTVLAGQLLRLKEGDVLGLGYPVERPVDCLVNGKCKYKARVMSSGSRINLQIDELVVSPGP